MKYTSKEANRILKKLIEDKKSITTEEESSNIFKASLGEDPETVRPDYDYDKSQTAISEINAKIRKVKHAINVLNTTTTLPSLGITIDEALVLMPQLTEQKRKLSNMSTRLKKQRTDNRYSSSPIIDYEYANYDINKAKIDYDSVSRKLSDLQAELDSVNNVASIEIDI